MTDLKRSGNENVFVVTRSRARSDVDADDKTETDVADVDGTQQQADDTSDIQQTEMPKINVSSSQFQRAQRSDPSLSNLTARQNKQWKLLCN